MPFQLWQIFIIILLEGQAISSDYIPNCKALQPLKYCPPYDSSEWKLRAYCKNCKADQKYHCCKDYDSPKLNCPQGDVYCKDELYVEGCAEEKFCKKGEEPVLSFIKNQVRVENPEVFCVLCYNNNRYNDSKNKSSATYSECTQKKLNICTFETHKIECRKTSGETSERFCRCDVENGYYPNSHPDDHPVDGCSYNNYICTTGRCGPNERTLLNYTCECEDGFYKHNNSMPKCVPLQTKAITVFPQFLTTSKDNTTSSGISTATIIVCAIAIPCAFVIPFVILRKIRGKRNKDLTHTKPKVSRQAKQKERNINQTEELMEELLGDEKREFVKEVTQHRIVHLRDNLDPIPIIDKLFQRQLISKYDYDSMMSKPNKPEQNRAILDKVMTRGEDFYKSFITEVFNLKQFDCFDALQEEERLVHKSIINKRENIVNVNVEIHESETPLLEMQQEESHAETETTI
ncbi:uncharacterized protein LOC132714687 [Ruditapes philippinarum]|uniref:uncharacterized protein LOC132714687 n=1 Tax=Ruditapes philippinarum TaxID=129788 RepID=UPI00295B18CB|nr:uncharacterized protein LOC132714687 [Ruditapes philippinarum]